MSTHDTEDAAGLLPGRLRGWLAEHAEVLDREASLAEAVLPQLAGAELFGIGVPARQGGVGGDIGNAIDAVSAIAEHSLTAAFVFWAQRAFIEYLLASPNEVLRDRSLAPLLGGQLAGASGLSNAMKFLAGVESLQIEARDEAGGWRLEGRMPWVTNLRQPDYLVAAAVSRATGGPAAVVALPGARTGMTRSLDLDLLGLRASNTAAIQVDAVRISDEDVLHVNGPAFLRAVRPSFLGLQCAMSIGLARSALAAAQAACRGDRHLLQPRIDSTREALENTTAALKEGVRSGRFTEHAVPLFELRIGLSQIVQEAVQLELQASGGRAYLLQPVSGFGRRLREAAFIPVVTPSVTQLQGELRKQGELQKLQSLVRE